MQSAFNTFTLRPKNQTVALLEDAQVHWRPDISELVWIWSTQGDFTVQYSHARHPEHIKTPLGSF